MAVTAHALTPGCGYLDAAAGILLASAAAELPDLSRHLVLVSSLPLAAELRTALARAAGRPLLLPQFNTLRRWALAANLPDLSTPMPESERLVLLHSALAARGWFDESALWGIAAELASLSDELSAAAVRLPDDADELTLQLERAYALRASEPLNFEARVVHEMWRALAAAGRPDAPSAYRLRLAQLAQLAEQPARPLFVLLDGPAEERLTPAELEFIERYGQTQPVLVCAPQPRASADTPLAAVLAAAWPEQAGTEPSAPLMTRAAELAAALPESPLAGRLQLVPVSGREAEAEAAAAQVFAWLAEGIRRIALVAEDRLSARRVRALLERAGVLAADETGWKLSTTRAAATLDALLETVAGSAYHLDLLDLFKSPHLFADLPSPARAAAVLALEQAIRRAGVKSGVPAFRRALAEQGERIDAASQATASLMLDRLEVAQRILGGKPAPLAKWIARLQRGLDALGAAEQLQADAAGGEMLELLLQRQGELAESTASFSFAAWRDWLNRELEGGAFRDRGIASSIVMLPRHDVRLRRFEAAIVIGADAEQLTPASGGTFFNQAVRRDLGLPTREDAERALRRDLELLLCTVPRVLVTWQHQQAGEARLLAPEFDLLSTLHQLAWGDDLMRSPLLMTREAAPAVDSMPTLPQQAVPSAPQTLVPARISVSGLSSLVACPYQFFARHVLRLNELDEVAEELEKSDYGQLVHRSLERFHAAHPSLTGLDDAAALAALSATVENVFAEAEADNWLALGWRLRWQARLPAYLAWQRERENAGWRWLAAEVKVAKSLPLPDGAAVELYGRIDRIDQAGPAGFSLLDYKTRKLIDLKKQMADDIQLPAYALLHGEAAEAAYVALDDEKVGAVACADDLVEAGAAQGERLTTAFAALRAGAGMPAHGVDSVCRWCEASGLCRRDHVQPG